MRTTKRLALAIGVAVPLLLPASAQAQDMAQLCKKARDVQVGQWAEYRMTGSGEGESGKMRLAVIGKEEVAGSTAWWIELQMKGEAGSVITQVLASGYPYDTGQIHGMIVKAGDQPAMKMPTQALAMMRNRVATSPSLGAAKKCEQSRIVGWETIQVPAGEFRALHVEPVDAKGEAWAVETVPFGLVRSRSKEAEVVLLGHGRDARSSITEKPLAIPGLAIP